MSLIGPNQRSSETWYWDVDALDWVRGTQPGSSGEPSSTVEVSNFPASQVVTGPITDAQLRASPIEVDVISMPAGGSGLTDAELRASDVKVSLDGESVAVTGTFFQAAQPITDNGGSVTVDGTFWQATQPISGTVTANAGSNLNTSALALDASITTLNTSVNTLLKPANTLAAVTSITNVVHVDDNASSLSIDDGGNVITVDGTVAVTNANLDVALSTRLKAADTLTAVSTVGTITNVVHVDDNASTLTVDAPVGTPVFVRLSDGAAAISTLPVSLASVPTHAVTQSGVWDEVGINDSGNSITVDGAVSVTGTVDIGSMPPISASSSADVFGFAEDAGYIDGDTGKNLTQTPEGFLRVAAAALVSDAVESYLTGSVAPLSINSEGRLRVSSVPAAIPTQADVTSPFSFTTGNPYDFLDNISPWD